MNNYFKIHKQKNVYKEYNKTESHLKGGIIGLKSKSYSRITNNQVESLRKDIVMLIKQNCEISVMLIKQNCAISTAYIQRQRIIYEKYYKFWLTNISE